MHVFVYIKPESNSHSCLHLNVFRWMGLSALSQFRWEREKHIEMTSSPPSYKSWPVFRIMPEMQCSKPVFFKIKHVNISLWKHLTILAGVKVFISFKCLVKDSQGVFKHYVFAISQLNAKKINTDKNTVWKNNGYHSCCNCAGELQTSQQNKEEAALSLFSVTSVFFFL